MSKPIVIVGSIMTSLIMLVPASAQQQDEKLTITTYYPSPTGVYQTLRVAPGNNPADCSAAGAPEGKMYYDASGRVLLICSNSTIGGWGYYPVPGAGGLWALNGANLTVANTTWYVGIGTSSPQSLLHVKGLPYAVVGDHSRVVLEMGAEGVNDAASFTFRNATFPVLGGIGYNSPTRTAYGGLNSLNIVQALNANLTFATSNTVRATIDGSGAMHYGAYTPGNAHINAFNMEFGGYNPVAASKNATILFHDWGVVAHQLRYQGGVLYLEASSSVPGYGSNSYPALQVGGNITAQAFFYSSDRALKTDIEPAQNSLEKILSLSGKTFKWKQDGRPDMGLIAQDVEQVYPELVSTDPVTGLKSIEYGNLIAPLIEAVREQQGQI
ncbi:MAG: tail fiber domain-containing protein, partial [Candidatus Omnitrophica bacterium]|nr:tail fiber domain-containing protein [Candidatus Omnitrophota bacterium]